MNAPAEPRRRFDQMTRLELLGALHAIGAKARVARAALADAQRTGDRETAAQLRDRISRLKTAASAAQFELAARNEQRAVTEAFVRVARQQLPADIFHRIDAAAKAAVA